LFLNGKGSGADFDFNPVYLPPNVSKGRLKRIKAVWKTKINQGGFIFFSNGRLKGLPLRKEGGGVFS